MKRALDRLKRSLRQRALFRKFGEQWNGPDAFDIDRIAKEVMKVLKPDGLLIVEAVQGRDQGVNPGFFESFFWKNIEELLGVFENAAFTVTRRTPITDPWPGEQICFQRAPVFKFAANQGAAVCNRRPIKTAVSNRRSLKAKPLPLEPANALRRIPHANRRNGFACTTR